MDEKLVALFNEMNPDTPLDHSTVDHEGFKQAIRAYLIAEPAPDVMTWFAGNRARFFIDNGLILDISDVWEEGGFNEDFPKGFRAMSSVDDKQYFVPKPLVYVYSGFKILNPYHLLSPDRDHEIDYDTASEKGEVYQSPQFSLGREDGSAFRISLYQRTTPRPTR